MKKQQQSMQSSGGKSCDSDQLTPILYNKGYQSQQGLKNLTGAK
ncbi:MAG TPA: hypothetical protein VFN95_14435 [Flavitalea sp.]|nr:hypothetical protein [Flavitalea sp.]